MTFKVIEAFGPIEYRKTYKVYDVRSHACIIEFLIYDEWHDEWKYVDANLFKPIKE